MLLDSPFSFSFLAFFTSAKQMEESYKSIKIEGKTPNSRVIYLYLNRPSQRNALSREFFTEFPKALSSLDQNPNVNVIVFSGTGDHFCSGIDLKTLSSVTDHSTSTDRGRFSEKFRRDIRFLQDAVTAIERCRKPVIASIRGACIGGGVDIVTACDIRFCSKDAFFSVKEVDLAITADLGTLQRLPAIVGYGNAMELALTGRRFWGLEAKELGLVSRVFGSSYELDQGVRLVAEGKLVFFSSLFYLYIYFNQYFGIPVLCEWLLLITFLLYLRISIEQ